MAVFLDCITLDCADARRLAAFWAAALGYDTRNDEGGGVVVQPTKADGPILGFQPVPEPKTRKTRVHLDVRVAGGATLEDERMRSVGLGARALRLIDDRPGNTHWIMRNPDGNEFCPVELYDHRDLP